MLTTKGGDYALQGNSKREGTAPHQLPREMVVVSGREGMIANTSGIRTIRRERMGTRSPERRKQMRVQGLRKCTTLHSPCSMMTLLCSYPQIRVSILILISMMYTTLLQMINMFSITTGWQTQQPPHIYATTAKHL
jgi:hypothetical protein